MLAFAAGQREGNSSILWKRRHDPGLPAALPFIHGFRPNFNSEFLAGRPAAPARKRSRNKRPLSGDRTPVCPHYTAGGSDAREVATGRHNTSVITKASRFSPRGRTDEDEAALHWMTFLLAIAVARAKAAVAF
jgi:hypothetical protein